MKSFEKTLFADTSFFYASIDARDSDHPQAQQWALQIQQENWNIITSWEIIVETITLLRIRYSYQAATSFIDELLPNLEIVYLDDFIRSKALTLFKKFSKDKRLSLCDIISYILIKEHFENIPFLAFDEDLMKMGLRRFTDF